MNRILIKIANRLGLLENVSLVSRITLNQRIFKIPIIDKIGLSNLNIQEVWMIDLLKAISALISGPIVDIGANIGQTLLKIKSIAPNAEYFGFEPNSACIYYLRKLVKENRMCNVTLIPVGIAECNTLKKLVFYYQSQTDSSATIIEKFRPNQKADRIEHVPVFEFKTIKNQIGFEGFSLLKIDVEGGEFDVLHGFKEELKKYNPIIIIEILPVYQDENKERLSRQIGIENLLKELKYSKYRIIINDGHFVGVKYVGSIGIHSELNDCEYLLVPENIEDNFRNLIEQAHKTFTGKAG